MAIKHYDLINAFCVFGRALPYGFLKKTRKALKIGKGKSFCYFAEIIFTLSDKLLCLHNLHFDKEVYNSTVQGFSKKYLNFNALILNWWQYNQEDG